MSDDEWNIENPNEWSEDEDDHDLSDILEELLLQSKPKPKSKFLELIEMGEQQEKLEQEHKKQLKELIQNAERAEQEQYQYLDYPFRQLCQIQISIGRHFQSKQQLIIGDIIAGYLLTTVRFTFDEHHYLKQLWLHCNVPDINIWYTNKYEEELMYLIKTHAKERTRLELLHKNGFTMVEGNKIDLTAMDLFYIEEELHKIRTSKTIEDLSTLERGIFMIEKRRKLGVDMYFY